MKSKKATKRALLTSAMSLVLCFAMLLGTTFAWFTDEAKTGVNTIQSGTLDVQLLAEDGTTSLEGQSLNFVKAEGGEGQEVLWEPGATYYTQGFQIKNNGSLWLKFEIVINGVSDGNAKLLEAIDFVISTDKEGKDGISLDNDGKMYELAPDATFNNATYYLVGHMKEDAGNEYQDLKIEGVGITVYATQVEAEFDSFGDDYDAAAPVVTYEVTPETIQDYLDGKYGSTSNMKLVLTEGNYDTLVLGRPTKYAGSNTTYICKDGNTHSGEVYETTDVDAFRAHLADNKWHTTPRYVTSLRNLQITVKEDAAVTVAGVKASSGHAYGDVYDYVRDIDYDVGSAYYSTLLMKDVTFTGITFVAGSDINTSDAETVIDGVTFENCTFTGTSTESGTGAAIRYYNEANNGNVRNLTVTGCSFDTWYQGVYTQHVKGITVTNNTFDTTGHNAVAIQSHNGAVNHGAVVISNNTFTNIGDRVIRFNEVGSGTQITIKYNVATNSGDKNGEVIKATSIAADVECDVNYNNWGDEKTVANEQFKDADEAIAVSTADELKAALAAETDGTTIVLAGGTYEGLSFTNPANYKAKNITIIGTYATQIAGFAVNGWSDTANIVIDGLTFKNVTFTSGLLLSTKEMANVTVEDCDFVNDACIRQNDNTEKLTNLVVKNCTFTGDKNGNTTALMLENTENVTVTGCTFTNIDYNVLQAGILSGTVLFDNNTVNGTGDRVFRFVNVSGANITISNNTITSDGDEAGELAKATDPTDIDLINNTWNGKTDAEVADKLINIQ